MFTFIFIYISKVLSHFIFPDPSWSLNLLVLLAYARHTHTLGWALFFVLSLLLLLLILLLLFNLLYWCYLWWVFSHSVQRRRIFSAAPPAWASVSAWHYQWSGFYLGHCRHSCLPNKIYSFWNLNDGAHNHKDCLHLVIHWIRGRNWMYVILLCDYKGKASYEGDP